MNGTITNYNTEWDIQQTTHLNIYFSAKFTNSECSEISIRCFKSNKSIRRVNAVQMVTYQQGSCNMYRLNLLQKNIKTKHAIITWLEIIQAVF